MDWQCSRSSYTEGCVSPDQGAPLGSHRNKLDTWRRRDPGYIGSKAAVSSLQSVILLNSFLKRYSDTSESVSLIKGLLCTQCVAALILPLHPATSLHSTFSALRPLFPAIGLDKRHPLWLPLPIHQIPLLLFPACQVLFLPLHLPLLLLPASLEGSQVPSCHDKVTGK